VQISITSFLKVSKKLGSRKLSLKADGVHSHVSVQPAGQ
jgi:hypothetical protein